MIKAALTVDWCPAYVVPDFLRHSCQGAPRQQLRDTVEVVFTPSERLHETTELFRRHLCIEEQKKTVIVNLDVETLPRFSNLAIDLDVAAVMKILVVEGWESPSEGMTEAQPDADFMPKAPKVVKLSKQEQKDKKKDKQKARRHG